MNQDKWWADHAVRNEDDPSPTLKLPELAEKSTKVQRVMAATHSYIGRLPCGCVVAAAIDTADRDTIKAVADFMRSGLTVERVTHEFVRENFTAKCKHR